MSSKGILFTVATVLALGSLIGFATAQQQPDVKVKAGKQKTVQSAKSTQGMAHRASEIQGISVVNEAGKELGTVKDVVVDLRTGHVKYAALSYGGFLGVGDKLFAVPWGAFGHRHETNSEHTLILGIDEAKLKNAPGFDQDKWPDFASPEFRDQIQKHYGLLGRLKGRRGAGVRVEAGPVVVDVSPNINKDRPKRTQIKQAKDFIHRSSEIIGMTVKDSAGKELGTVNDLVIDIDTGRTRYAAISYGGFLGLGDKLFAVPWKAFACKHDISNKTAYLVLAVDEQTLKKAPGFDPSSWPNLADPKFGNDIDSYYGPLSRRAERPAKQTK